jgi:RNA polymerase sigma-70 factor (ECF subfamily)
LIFENPHTGPTPERGKFDQAQSLLVLRARGANEVRMADAAPDSDVTCRLLSELETGGNTTFDQVLDRHRPFLRRVIEVRLDPRLRSRVDPSDVVQDTQLEAYRRLPDYLKRRPMPFRLWLWKTAREQVLMIYRKHIQADRRSIEREKPLVHGSSVQLAEQLLAGGPSPSQQLGRNELARRVQEAVSRLPEADQEILLMRHFEGLSHGEVADLLEIESAAARKRYGRALLRLHKLLAEQGVTESQL